MKKAILLSLLLIIPTISSPKNGITLSKGDLATFVIASYNITHGKKKDLEWEKREKGAINVVKGLKADILCIQELIKEKGQLKSVEQALGDYNVVGEPRSSGITNDVSLLNRIKYWFVMTGIPHVTRRAEDEYCPIFFNKNKFDLVETKTVGINGEGSALLPRIYTMARLKEKNTGKTFDIYNTHLDNDEQKNRLMQLKLITQDINRYSKGIPTILLGDFNTELTDDIKAVLATDKFVHAKNIAQKKEGDAVTHKKKDGKSIESDHIFIKPESDFSVELYKTSNTMSDETSDHNPVSMQFLLSQ